MGLVVRGLEVCASTAGRICAKGIGKLVRAPFTLSRVVADRFIWPWWLRVQGVQFGAGLILGGCPEVRMVEGGKIELGRNVRVFSRPLSNPLHLQRPCTFFLLRANATIEAGDDSGFSGTVICAASAVKIGMRVSVGANTTIMDTDFHPVSPAARRENPTKGAVSKPVMIGNDVWIGAHVIILPGTILGDGCVVAAGAVVSGNFSDFTIVVGNPARAVKRIDRIAS